MLIMLAGCLYMPNMQASWLAVLDMMSGWLYWLRWLAVLSQSMAMMAE
jgi:hypothetical protein